MMQKTRFFFFCLAMIPSLFVFNSAAQEVTPDLTVASVRLGDRASAKAFLDGYQARIGEDGRPTYYFFNKFANQVLKLTGASFEDRFFITEIEVYKVGKNYTAGHFQAEKISHFKTEKDIFIGYRQSKASAITGIPNVDGKDRTGPKTVATKIGAPTERVAADENETLIYKLSALELADETGQRAKYDYSAQYEFNGDKLKKFTLKISNK
jgi:hypothetical protein